MTAGLVTDTGPAQLLQVRLLNVLGSAVAGATSPITAARMITALTKTFVIN